MTDIEYIHNDSDRFHGESITLHDCAADHISFSDGILRFRLADGIWITPLHRENNLNKTVRTDSAVVDIRIASIENVSVRLFSQNIFKRTFVETWAVQKLMDAVNKGRFTIEFITQYRSDTEQIWCCAIHTKKKLYYRECQLYLPDTEAVFRWNNLLPDREW